MLQYTTTESGVVEGYFGHDPRVTVFKGVPYAAPPVGPLRWRAPQPMPKWEGVRRADRYMPMAWQRQPGVDPNEFWTREIHPTGAEFAMSEDCLYVNIYTPAKTGDEKLPVLYYIHGGGYQGGYPYEIEFDWEHVAQKGIVVVAVAYRLGVFGFLAHPLLSAEAPEAPKGNYGIQDQLAGLAWTHRNIAAFGGDPDKITIAGQSAGAGSVQCLITSPLAEGLISGAIIQSAVTTEFADTKGGFLRSGSLEAAEQEGVKFFDELGVTTLEQARALPTETVFAKSGSKGRGFRFAPVVDHIMLMEPAFPTYLHNRHHRIPVLTGYNRGEMKMFSRMGGGMLPKTLAEYDAFAARYGGKEAEFRALCPVSTDEDVQELFQSAAFDGMAAGLYLFGTLQARQGRTSYLYEFDPSIPGEDNAGSFHGSELFFAYDSLARSWRPFTGKHYDLARQVNAYWVNFVKHGDPNGTDCFGNALPQWRKYTEEDQFVLEIQDEILQKPERMDAVTAFRVNDTLSRA